MGKVGCMKVLQLYYKVPFPQHDGGAMSIYSMSKSIIESGAQLDIIAIDQLKSPADKALIPKDFEKNTTLEIVGVDNRVKYGALFIQLFKSTPYWISRFYSKEFEALLIKKLQNKEYDIIQLEHLYLGLYISAIRKFSKGKIILRAQNVEHLLWKSIVETSTSFFRKLYIKLNLEKLYFFEKKVVNDVDHVFAISKDDHNELKKFSLLSSKISVVPFVYEVTDIKLNNENYPLDIYHLGSMDWMPNQQGVDWFLKEIAPINNKLDSKFQFHIGGKNLPKRYLELKVPGVSFYNEIDLVETFIKDKSVLFIPLLSGSGVRIKIIEAFAHGKIVVATSKAVEGLDIKDKVHFLLANTASQFIDAFNVINEKEELRSKLKWNAFEFVKANLSVSSNSKLLNEKYEELKLS